MKSLFSRTLPALLLLTFSLALSGCPLNDSVADKEWNDYVGPHRHDLTLQEGFNLHYIDLGEGVPVFMLHGFSSSTYAWKMNVKPVLNAGFRAILVDLPGQGFSAVPPESYIPSVENIAGAVLQLADHLGLDRFHLVGVSMGGGLTLYLTWKHPDRVDRAVVLDPASFEQQVPFAVKILTTPGIGQLAAQANGRWTTRASLRNLAVQDEQLTKTYIKEYTRPFIKPGYKQFIHRLINHFFSDEFSRMVTSYDTISRPLLIIWGKQDPWIPVEFGERLHWLVEDSQLVLIDDCGHMVQLERPDIVNRETIKFLKGK